MDTIIQSLVNLSSPDLHLLYSYHGVANPQSLARILHSRGTLPDELTSDETALVNASVKGDYSEVQRLIESGVNPNILINGDIPLLQIAAAFGHIEILKYLVDRGADVNFKNKLGQGALLVNIGMDHSSLEIVKYLVEHGADVNTVNKIDVATPLHFSIHLGLNDISKYLVDNGADINAAKDDGITPLMIASKKPNPEILKYLIEKGADLNIIDKNGSSAIMHADKRSLFRIVEILINAGANISGLLLKRHNLHPRIKSLVLNRTREKVDGYIARGRNGVLGLRHMTSVMCKNLASDYNISQLRVVADALRIVYPKKISKENLCGLISAQILLNEVQPSIGLQYPIDYYSDPEWIGFMNKRAPIIDMTTDIVNMDENIDIEDVENIAGILTAIVEDKNLNNGDVIKVARFYYVYNFMQRLVLPMYDDNDGEDAIPNTMYISENIPTTYWSDIDNNNIWLSPEWMGAFIENLEMVTPREFITRAKFGKIEYILNIRPVDEFNENGNTATLDQIRQELTDYLNGESEDRVKFYIKGVVNKPWVEVIDCTIFILDNNGGDDEDE